MIAAATLLFALAGPPEQAALNDPPSSLAKAEALYASAEYEEALTLLSGSTERDSVQVEQYRALCLLALGRTTEAQQSLEKLVSRSPFYRVSAAQVSPRLVTLFHDVRQRLLPAAVKDAYASGKTMFEAKDYAGASRRFRDVLALLDDEDLAPRANELADLRTLADGFLKLAVAADVPPPPAPAPVAAKPVPVAPSIYSADDTQVVAPVDIDRRLPPWKPPFQGAAVATGRGILEIVIDERGAVESAVVRTSISRFYDSTLVEAARKWRFRPATLNGQPVKYRKLITVQLSGS
jgi:protein TonB